MTVTKRGDHGPAVEQIQRALRDQGIDVDVDGQFRSRTTVAAEAFQHLNGPLVDGDVVPQTSQALELSEQSVPDVVFTVPGETVPVEVHQVARCLVDAIGAASDQILTSSQLAIEQFDTTMQLGSTQNHNCVPAPLMAEVLRAVGHQVARRIDALMPASGGVVGGLLNVVVDGVNRAGLQAPRARAGQSIKSQRTVLDDGRRSLTLERKLELAVDIESWYLQTTDKVGAFIALTEAVNRLAVTALPDVSELEARLYEHWINDHFVGMGKAELGCVEFRYEHDNNTVDFVACTVQAPCGSQVEDGLNRLFLERLVPRASRPIDLRVRKRACFLVNNGNLAGKSWVYGWLDADNHVISMPADELAQRAIQENVCRLTGRFDAASE